MSRIANLRALLAAHGVDLDGDDPLGHNDDAFQALESRKVPRWWGISIIGGDDDYAFSAPTVDDYDEVFPLLEELHDGDTTPYAVVDLDSGTIQHVMLEITVVTNGGPVSFYDDAVRRGHQMLATVDPSARDNGAGGLTSLEETYTDALASLVMAARLDGLDVTKLLDLAGMQADEAQG